MEYQIKATFLYNLAHFVQWPTEKLAGLATFTICISGQNPFGKALELTIKGQKIGNRPLQVRQVSSHALPGNCQILFIAVSEESRLADILAKTVAQAILTVSDMADFARRGGMVYLYKEGDRVRLAINIDRFAGTGLQPSAGLLALAKVVQEPLP